MPAPATPTSRRPTTAAAARPAAPAPAARARLHHPKLVGVRGHGTAYGVPYLVSDHVDGPRLDRALGRPPHGRPVGELLPLATGVARALAYLHGNGHVHQDVKPSNVLV